MGTRPRSVDVHLDLLDRQIVDADGRPAGKVDDLEFELPEDGSPPVLTTILGGPDALGPRVGGRLGSWIVVVGRRLRPDDGHGPIRIPFGLVDGVDDHVQLRVSQDQACPHRLEDWLRVHVIERIPGASRENG